jgi:hypothetical protein
MNDLDITRPDPSRLGFPPTLPIEVALRMKPVKDICAAYGIERLRWDALRVDPVFILAVKGYVEALKKEGMSFKLKAALQSEELLVTSWNLIHDKTGDVPPSVKADLIKYTVNAAGLGPSKNVESAGAGNALSINIHLR